VCGVEGAMFVFGLAGASALELLLNEPFLRRLRWRVTELEERR
jgi:hypothetical protein